MKPRYRIDPPRIWSLLATSTAIFMALVGSCIAKPGSLDPSLGTNGEVRTLAREPIEDPSISIALDSKGRIDLVGTLQHGVAAIRYRPNGRLDPTFAGLGETDLHLGEDHFSARDLAIDQRGRIVIGGTESGPEIHPGSPSPGYWFALVRLNPNGTRDKSFGKDGLVATHIGLASEIKAIKIDSHNRIIAVGYTASNTDYANEEYVVARFLPDGRLDPSFSGDGVVTGLLGALGSPAQVVAVDPAGRIVVGGSAVEGAGRTPRQRYALIRLTESGRLDRTFGKGGEVRTKVGKGQSEVIGLRIDRRGRILAIGNTTAGCGLSGNASLARYMPDGRLDRSFSGDGIVVTHSDLNIDSFAVDRSGRIVLGGNIECLPIGWAVARLRSDGGFDSSFGNEGISESSDQDRVSDLALDRKGRIIAAGTQYPRELNGVPEIVLKRYLAR